jgi:Pro-kumamolisin, activation domain/Bacterial Ig-like domain (group 3)
MKLQSWFLRTSLFVSVTLPLLGAPRVVAQSSAQTAAATQSSPLQAPAVPARITPSLDETQLVRLKGNVHPLARPEFDQGAVSDSTPMNRMLMVLQRSSEQQAALTKLMDEQLIRDSPNYHKWLTPQQFGAQFGPADADIQTVTDWLTQQGFRGIKVSNGRTTIEFSGTVGQVRNAFHTEIHRYLVNGEMKQANATDPQIPAALTPVVAGIASLHNFRKKSMRREPGVRVAKRQSGASPLFTTPPNCGTAGNPPCAYFVGPADFAKIYNFPPTTLNGTGVTIALVADSNIDPTDITNFRALFGLTPNFTAANIIVNGPDPGISGPNGDEVEADLDVETAGMVATGATIKLVVSEPTLTADGVDLSALYIVDNNIADVVSESFGACEAVLGTDNLFQNLVWEQAAAQGITVAVSTGDSGSAGCDDFTTQTVATGGLAVSGVASTPFNVGVGGTDFDDVGAQATFWSTTNASGSRESALGYIPEIPWNDSCAATATSANLSTVCATANGIVAGSGGPSSLYAKPSWQSGLTPSDGHRDLPDVSLFASDGANSDSFYPLCESDIPVPAGSPPICAPDAQGHFILFEIGGTSASSPAFAGIMALVIQQLKAINPGLSGRQGNANPVLYTIAKAETFSSCNSSSFTNPMSPPPTSCAFLDITKNTNAVPCAGQSPNCSSTTSSANGVLVDPAHTTTPAWTAGTGYDMATGLGSVNVTNLAAAWSTAVGAFKATTTATKINGGTTTVTITHGQSVTLSATVTSATGTPTGDVSFLAPTSVNSGIGAATLNSLGTATLMAPSATAFPLPGGSYNLKAHYAGDGTFAPSDDSAGVSMVVNKENSSLHVGIITFDPTTLNVTSNNATTVAYGSQYRLRFDIANSSGSACTPVAVPPATPVTTGCAVDATGNVVITDNGSPLDQGTFPVNSEGSGEDQPIQLTGGTHTLLATYSGDISYNAPAGPTTDTVTVTKANTSTQVAFSPQSVTTATAVTLSATISSQSIGTLGPSGTVTFFDGGTQIGSPAAVTPAGATSTTFAGGTASLTNTFSTTGTHTITATYNGDTNYSTSAATGVPITVNSSGSFSVSEAAVTATAGGSGMSTFTATPSGGFTGAVTISCSSLPPGVTASPNCAASPSAFSVTVPSGGGNGTGTLTLNVAAPSSSMSASVILGEREMYWAAAAPTTGGGKGWWGLGAATGFAAILLLLLPGRKRYRTAFALGLICVLSLTLGCNGGYGGSGGGPATTTTSFSVASTKVPSGTNIMFTVKVTSTGTTAAGTAEILEGATVVGSATVSGGTATISSSTLAVGTHALTASYLGDAYTKASQSGMLNVTVTGSTTVAITSSPTATPAAAALSLTIN